MRNPIYFLLFFFVASIGIALASGPAVPGLPGSAFVEAQLRNALRDSFGLDEEIEVLAILSFTGPYNCFTPNRQVSLTKNGLRLETSSKGLQAQVTIPPDRYIWSGSSKDGNSRLEAPIRIQFLLRASQQRLVLRRGAHAGEVLSEDLVSLQRIPWRLKDIPAEKECCRMEYFLGRQLSRSLKGGTILVRAMTMEAAVVRAGEVVSFVSKGTGVSIGTEAIAGQSGKLGDWIFLRRLDSGLRLRGVVGGAGLVYSQPTPDSAQARSAR